MLKSRLWHTIAFAAIFCIALGTFLGCSQDRRYKVLSFFFDGVPAPGDARGGAHAGERTVYQHKPYADGKCGLCHGTDDIDMSIARPTNITQISSALCLRCHEKVRAEHVIMHGPVTATECLMCHNPHESGVAHLLKAPAPPICTQCHAPEMMLPLRPEHADQKADCLNCHFGHGGPAHGLLRPISPASTQPANAQVEPPQSVAEGRASL